MPLSLTQIENLSRQQPEFAVGDTVVLQHVAGLGVFQYPVGSQWEVVRPQSNHDELYYTYVRPLGTGVPSSSEGWVELMAGRFVPCDSPGIVTRPKVNHKIGVPKGKLP